MLGARIEDALQEHDTKEHNAAAVEIEARALIQICSALDVLPQLFDIGPGNGSHSAELLSRIHTLGFRFESYLGLDASSEMLRLTSKRLSRQFPALPVSTSLWDLESMPTDAIVSTHVKEHALLLMVGNTLAGVEDPLVSLKHIASSCFPGDTLVLHVNRVSDVDDATVLQRFKDNLIEDAVLSPLIAAGISICNGHLEVRFSRSLNSVVADFVFEHNQVLTWQAETMAFNVGDTIRCFLSRRFNDEYVEKLMRMAGWQLEKTLSDATGIHGVYVARRIG